MPIQSPSFFFAIFLLILLAPYALGPLTPTSWLANPARDKRLEGLRGLLAPSVMIYHSLITYYFYAKNGAWEIPPSDFYFRMGTSPVMVFFYITGYLFWTQFLNGRPYAFRPFIRKRFLRLAPAFYLATAVVIFIVSIEANLEMKDAPGDLFSHILSWVLFGLPWGDFQAINGALHPEKF